MKEDQGRKRVTFEAVTPEIDGGLFPIKRVVGEKVEVEADILVDGHDLLTAVLLYRKQEEKEWSAVVMETLVNDRWRGSFRVTELGNYIYTLRAWVDRFKTWRRDLEKRIAAGQEVSMDLRMGVQLIEDALPRCKDAVAKILRQKADQISGENNVEKRIAFALEEDLTELMSLHAEKKFITSYGKELKVVVDRKKARFSAWYEMFPRSCVDEAGKHGTFRDCEGRLPYIADMGFDVLYFPPIHPIGITHRKGKNNSPEAGPKDPGSPWAIGSAEGGHKSIHPELGNLQDFQRLLKKAGEHGIEIALDLAFQCSPDHPYVKEHPEWFRHRPDGTVQYAENPPKKYEDIYPIDFETDHWQEVFAELKSVVLFWMEQGVRIFRMDNPHTKPFRFWEWLISEVKRDYPEAIFLSEAFTRPKVMYRLAKLGFSQSYSYFAWRNTKWEITQYFSELTQTQVREFFRPNLWPNTPDILTEYLQMGGRPAYMTRVVLAATLGASYGIYGPAFELCEERAKEYGSEEYLDSEKYEIRRWNLDDSRSLKDFITRVNRVRRENQALQSDLSLRFHTVENDNLLCYTKSTEDLSNIVLMVVNLDPHHTHGGWLHLPAEELGLEPGQPFQVHDLLSNARFLWHGPRNYVELDPHICPAYLFRLRKRVRTERDFDYFM
jgi:starch synthase (maltosyl-transferring)